MGNPAIHTISGNWGVTQLTGLTEEPNMWSENMFCYDNLQLIYCYHPSSIIYDQKKKNDIIECIKMLKE